MTDEVILDPTPSLQLGQSRPANTTAVSIYTLPSNTKTKVNSMSICNTSGSAATYRVFHDVNGTTYDQTTALFYDISLAADQSVEWEPANLWLNNTSGNIAVRTGTGNAVTFTLYGEEHQLSVTVN